METLGVVATPPENARLYFKFRPTRLRLAADPELTTHRAYGVPKPMPTPEFMKALETTRINPDGELPEPLPITQAAAAVAELDGYAATRPTSADMQRQWPQLKGQFLIDRDGIVRWVGIECGRGHGRRRQIAFGGHDPGGGADSFQLDVESQQIALGPGSAAWRSVPETE